jgi:SAM-dependent methyltransferase
MVKELAGSPAILDRFGDLIACHCGGKLQAKSESELTCDSCGQRYEFKDSVLSQDLSVLGASPERELQKQEESIRDKQASYYDLMVALNLSSWIEVRKIERMLSRLTFKDAVEAGCGTGRFTLTVANRAQRLVAIDRSRESLLLCRNKLEAKGLQDRVLLVQADANFMPIAANAYDFAITVQVIQHLPTAEMRQDAIAKLAASLKPTGSLLFSGYQWSSGMSLLNHKEGMHRAGIPFIRFTREDLRELLGDHFDVRQMESSVGKLLIAVGARK